MTDSWHPLNTINRLLIDNLFLRFIEDRYKYMREVAQSRAILSLGISCFKLKKTKTTNDTKNKESEGRLNVRVKTYNIVVLCTENFIVEPASLKFLVGHGFDFNKQYASGVPYSRGDDKVGTPVSLEYVFFSRMLWKIQKALDSCKNIAIWRMGYMFQFGTGCPYVPLTEYLHFVLEFKNNF